jgi:hypothetical protein
LPTLELHDVSDGRFGSASLPSLVDQPGSSLLRHRDAEFAYPVALKESTANTV